MLAKAALLSFAGGLLGPLPDIIVFQYNPAELTRSLQQKRATTPGAGEPTETEPYRVDGPPAETIALKAEFDGDDLSMDGNVVTPLVGVRASLASLELLLYAKDQNNVFSMLAGASSQGVQPDEMPLVIFVWGPGRVLPVRLTAMTIREQEFDNLLNPIRAEVELTLEILKRLPVGDPGRGVYDYTEKQMRIVSKLQMVNNVQSVISGLPIV